MHLLVNDFETAKNQINKQMGGPIKAAQKNIKESEMQ